jgi:hypothetical protein
VCLCVPVYLFIELPLDSGSIQFFMVVGIKVMPLDVSPMIFPNININSKYVDLLAACDRMIINGISK